MLENVLIRTHDSRGDFLEKENTNRSYCHVAYKQFTWWFYRRLRNGNRRAIPPCAFSLLNRVLGVLACSQRSSTPPSVLLLACFTCKFAFILGVLAWLRAPMLGVFACLHARMLNMLACLPAWRAYVLACLACWPACVVTCLACLLVLFLTCSQVLHVCCAKICYMLTCLHASLTSFVQISF